MNGSELNVEYLSGRFEIEETQTFAHIPFVVPAGVRQMRIQVSYNDQISSDPREFGGNVLDIGLFDALGVASGSEGFRGWSGSNKLDLVIGEEWSTPPYRAGAMPANTWHLLFGAYKVGPNGLDWSARIEFDPEPELPPAYTAPQVTLPALPEDLPPALPGWYRGDLHAHTIFSDGTAHPAQMAVAARMAGLDFFGITDHNRAQSPVGLVPDGPEWPLLVPGVEVTTYAGHFNVWGTDRWYDFREPNPEGLQRAVDAALADGGFVSMNHPKPFGPPWEYPEVTGFHGIEVWNGWWATLNHVSTRVWDEALRRGERPVLLAGSDVHRLFGPTRDDNPFVPAALGHPTTWVKPAGPPTVASILEALRRGDVFISESPAGPQIEVRQEGARVRVTVAEAKGDAVLAIDQDGVQVAWAVDGNHAVWEIEAGPGSRYLRFEVHKATGGVRALTNAVFF